MLLRDGEILPRTVKRALVTEAELETVVRTEGQRDPETVAAVILESDGSFSVIAAPEAVRRTGSGGLPSGL
nr:YetF domain-containing protein [Roseovarius atlanticus]